MDLTLLKTFATVIEAEAAQKFLEAHGIKSVFQTTKFGSTGYFGNDAGGELYVKQEDVEKARELLIDKKSIVAGVDYIGVGVGVLIVNDKNETLLMKRGPKCRNLVGYWNRPGGTMEFGE